MMVKVVLFFLLGFSHSLFAGNFEQGVSAYNQKNYQEAVQLFEHAIEDEPANSSAYYNLALAHYELKQFGQAIWGFEKVLQLSSNDSDSKEKIQLIYSEIHPDKTWHSRTNRLESVLYAISPTTWAILSIIFSLLLAASIVFFFKSHQVNIKRLCLAFGFTGLLLTLFSLIVGNLSNAYQLQQSLGVVTNESSPKLDETSKNKIGLFYEGERIQIIETIDSTYYKVEEKNGSFLIDQSSIRRI